MKTCLISGEFPPMQGGVGDYTKELGLALASEGVEVCVITSTKADANFPSLKVLPIIKKWNWRSWGSIIKVIEQEKPQVVHIQYQAAAYGMHPAINFLPWRLRLMNSRPRIVTTFHDLRVPYLFPKAGVLRRWVVMAMARGCDAVIVTNVEDLLTLRQHIERNRLLPKPALHHIPIGSNIKPLPPPNYNRDAWRARWGVSKEDFLLSYFGFLNETKGGETLIKALFQLVENGYPTKLLMVGGQVGASDPTNVEYARRIKALVEELGLEKRVMWTGYTPPEEVSANLMASDVCVLPYKDGVSLRRGSLHAALIHCLPVISTFPRVPVKEFVNGQNILLIPPNDPNALAEAVIALYKDPALRERLGRGACELAKEFGWEGIAKDTLEVYESMLGI
ncbi:MAG TPA: glycosyltransferase family 1 protein [Chloroflexi bacterium]|nr:glycosyltransferase family 1 protein [Chloroflexota bacterium]